MIQPCGVPLATAEESEYYVYTLTLLLSYWIHSIRKSSRVTWTLLCTGVYVDYLKVNSVTRGHRRTSKKR